MSQQPVVKVRRMRERGIFGQIKTQERRHVFSEKTQWILSVGEAAPEAIKIMRRSRQC